jgi:hypothetical protein
MSRLVAVVTLLLLALACAACKTSETSSGPRMGAPDESGRLKVTSETSGPSSDDPGALSYVAAPFENVVYLPWKLVGGALKGAADGVGAGFAKDEKGGTKMPALGVVFAPINLVLGFVTGMFEGVALDPFLVGPSDDFGRAMGQPMRHPTTIWWY